MVPDVVLLMLAGDGGVGEWLHDLGGGGAALHVLSREFPNAKEKTQRSTTILASLCKALDLWDWSLALSVLQADVASFQGMTPHMHSFKIGRCLLTHSFCLKVVALAYFLLLTGDSTGEVAHFALRMRNGPLCHR